MGKVDSVYELGRIWQYIMQMRPLLRKDALFSDGTADYRQPVEPRAGDKVTIRFRTAADNADIVWLCENKDVPVRYKMRRTETKDGFDYYSVTVEMGEEPFFYYFEIASGLLHVYYDCYGISRDVRSEYAFRILPGFSTPDWAKGAVMYQILVDRFYNGDPSNDVLTDEYFYIRGGSRKVEDWNQCPSDFSVAEFYGGDLEGVRQKLNYLQRLGGEVIYFNPLFVSPSNHKYDIQDYDFIDPHIGRIVEDEGVLLPEGCSDNQQATRYISRVTSLRNLRAGNQLFAELVEEIHARGMKVILDGVFNHCGSFNKWMDREKIYARNADYETGAFIAGDSPYRDFFRFENGEAWPYNTSYEGWWGHDTLPKLNYENSKELTDYIMKIAAKWVAPPYNADGWRLDVAADVGYSAESNHKFWKRFRQTVREANPDAIVIAEHYGNPRGWLNGREWDSVMNYDAFMEPVTWFLTGMQKHSDDYREDLFGNVNSFMGAMRYYMANFTLPSLQIAMNELSNHDHSRFLTRTNKKVGRTNTLGPEAANMGVNKAVMREAVVIQMTWPGAPAVYYGDEAGVCGFTDPDNRRTYPWGHEDKEMIEFHRDMIRIHKQNPEILTGSLKYITYDYNILGYGRFNGKEAVAVVVNNNTYQVERQVSVWPLGIPKECVMERLIITTAEGYTTEAESCLVEEGILKIVLPPTSAVVLKYKR